MIVVLKSFPPCSIVSAACIATLSTTSAIQWEYLAGIKFSEMAKVLIFDTEIFYSGQAVNLLSF